MKNVITFDQSDLCSRSQASIVRKKVIPFFEAKRQVIFDFSNVETMSGSYANELFGALTRMFGIELAIMCIRLVGANEHCAEAVARQIDSYAGVISVF